MSKKTIALFMVGFVLVIAGITLTIKDWVYIQIVFRGMIGPLLAVGGLVVLAIARD